MEEQVININADPPATEVNTPDIEPIPPPESIHQIENLQTPPLQTEPENFENIHPKDQETRTRQLIILKKCLTWSPRMIWKMITTLGVVYGDLATSVMYTQSSIFKSAPNWIDVLGSTSLIIYTLLLIVVLKYVLIVMRFDYEGEGGLFMLTANIQKKTLSSPTGQSVKKWILIVVSIIGSSFCLGDGVITPPMEVLSAIQGIQVYSTSLQPAVVPIACFILFLLFCIQSFGSQKIGWFFGPVMCLFLILSAVIGIINIVMNPLVLYCFNPYYIILFFKQNGTGAFLQLGGVVLAVSGVEAICRYGTLWSSTHSIGMSICRIALCDSQLFGTSCLVDDVSTALLEPILFFDTETNLLVCFCSCDTRYNCRIPIVDHCILLSHKSSNTFELFPLM
jgi:hypothetical protein